MARIEPPRGDSAVFLAGMAVLAAGCGPSRPGAGAREQVLVGRAEPLRPSSMSPAQLTAAEDAFSLALFGRLCPAKPGANLLISPESAAEALGMLDAGARGPTAAALGPLLRLPAWTPGLVAALARHTAALAGQRQLAVSNHLFEQSGDRPAERVLDDLRTAYRAGVGVADFGDEPAATDRINAIVARETHGLLPALFPAPLPVSTRVVLTDALYLKAPWRQPFPGASPAPFRTAGGRMVRVPVMTSTVPVARLPPGRRLAVGHPAVRGGGSWRAVALLPPARAATCAVPALSQWTALTAGTSTRSAAVQLPRLHLSQTWDDLQSPLAAMGLPLQRRLLHGPRPGGQPDLRRRPARRHGRHPGRGPLPPRRPAWPWARPSAPRPR